MKQLYTLIFIAIAFFTQGQVVLQDFSNTSNNAGNDVWVPFGAGQTTAADVDPLNSNNAVYKVETTADGNFWKGFTIRPQNNYINLTSNQTVSLKVYSTQAIYLRAIMQGGLSGQPNSDDAAFTASHTGSGWETLTWTFTGATGEYGEFAVRTNVASDGTLPDPPTTAISIYVDDLTAIIGSAIPAPSAPSAGATAPTEVDANVLSLFSDAYTDVAVDTWLTSWSSGTLADEAIAGDNVKKYSSAATIGIETVGANLVDASGYNFIHFDVWTQNATTLKLKLVDFGADEAYAGGDDTEHEVVLSPTLGEWNSYHIALSDFTNLTNRDNLAQYIFSPVPANTSSFYLDNVYFHNNASLLSVNDFSNSSFSIYPNPAKNTLNVSAATAIDQVSIFDLTGRRVLQATPKAASFSLDVSNLNKGMYLVSLKAGDKEMTTKLVK